MSEEKVVSLKLVPPVPQAVSISSVEILEAALQDVREGEAVAIGIVIAYRDGTVSTEWSRDGKVHFLTSGAATLLHRLAVV